ncbi:voltage-dependent P/Q-type calcium channel subunit alpha-1A [Salvelinus sp. IW2-2015]|uniref:voltage-dependent P/Q-type calcium channel subunit alpha-1A n=1 Tax=Salvelinus sp. IW2-2015 TaxID=2691554 RepID=UPI0038D3575D
MTSREALYNEMDTEDWKVRGEGEGEVSYPHRAGDMKTHLDRPLVVNPQDNRNNNTNKTRPGEPPLDPQDTLGHQRAEEYIRRQACYHQRNRGGEPRGVSGTEREARLRHGGSRLSLQTLEGIEERREHGRRCRHKEGKEGRSVSPHYSEGGVGDEKRRHRRRPPLQWSQPLHARPILRQDSQSGKT